MSQRASLYVTWLFSVVNEVEVAQTGVHLIDTSEAIAGIAEIWPLVGSSELQALDTAMDKLWSATCFSFADYGRYNAVKVAYLGTDGQYADEPKIYLRPVPKPGNGPGRPNPQDAIVISLRAATTFGKATKGRMYLPYAGPNSWNSGEVRMPGALVNAMALAAGDFIGDVNAAFNIVNSTLGTKVECAILHSDTGLGASNRVATVAVGDIVDTQRRRRRQLTELYYPASLS